MNDLQGFLRDYEKAHPHLVVHVEKEVAAKWEASAIAIKAQKEQGETPVFVLHRLRTVDGRISPFPMVLNLFASRSRCAFALGSTFHKVGFDISERRSKRVKPVVIDRKDAPVKEVVKTGTAVDLRELPAIVHAAWDPGPYVSAGFLTSYDPGSMSAILVKFVEGYLVSQGVSQAEVDAWAEELPNLGSSGDYFFSSNEYMFTADRP